MWPLVVVAALDVPGSPQHVDTDFTLTCPYCGEELEVYLEADVRGTLVQDCEICCNPLELRVVSDAWGRSVQVRRADSSE